MEMPIGMFENVPPTTRNYIYQCAELARTLPSADDRLHFINAARDALGLEPLDAIPADVGDGE